MSGIDNLPSGTAPPGGSPSGGPPTGSITDLFAQLVEFQWRGIGFPVVETELEVRQDLVIHKWADRNGAYVEGTGRHPLQITARIPFLNTIYPGPSESWPQGVLYPNQWRLFLAACADNTSGTLQHPELGALTCKCEVSRTRWSGSVQGGVFVNVTWLESDDTGVDQLGHDLSQQSPIANLQAAGGDLDAQIASIDPSLVPMLPEFTASFASLVSAVIGVIDTVTILSYEYQGQIENILYQANELETALDLAENASPLNWPLYQNAEILKDAAYQQQQKALVSSLTVLTYTTPKDATLGEIAFNLGALVPDLILLNPSFVGTPVVPRGATIRYYQQAA